MPRSIRNFWYDTYVDGRRIDDSGGPRSKDGGMTIRIKQRDAGSVVTALRIECNAHSDGSQLGLTVEDGNGNIVHTFNTER